MYITKAIILLLLLTSCTVDIHRAQLMAVKRLTRAGYQTDALVHEALVITVDDRKWIYKEEYGCYNGYTLDILVYKNANYGVVYHEYMHYYLHQLWVDIGLHHKVMNSLLTGRR